ncbi:LysR family transcriptional regulator [Asticcacaulis excentricus]|uniref:Transcriptional regulator, LysR family n=1 Tax=Asticcacaulis excentricus (strain ATCC 15261 / DSM 4724 / KCTC 12464 / NCIMB 9791 / VKM B-1370 / CB 48) TaxID=573065 RepID=E8RNH4_ASTEC|nr:LysR family transcriptional regulator [Asticcacaulis excentricus]ADU11805.1 transcriptional regulator, LysR family [Asticcacaulis excentricus CB 48]
MLRLDALRIFTRVAELSSFSQASETLGLPKATVSTAVQTLEAHLGTQLLYRTTRRVQLTHDGQLFYERAKDLLADADDLSGLFQTRSVSGRIRVDMPIPVAQSLVIPNLPLLLERHPDLRVELSSTDRIVDIVREGFDCVIRVGTLSDTGLTVRALGKLSMGNFASPEYLARWGTPRTLEDLKGHRLIHYVTQMGARPDGFDYSDGTQWQTMAMEGVVTVNNSEAYRHAALAGLGIVQAPRVGMTEHVAQGRLIEILPAYVADALPVSLIYPQRRHLARRVRVFIDWVATLMKTYTN